MWKPRGAEKSDSLPTPYIVSPSCAWYRGTSHRPCEQANALGAASVNHQPCCCSAAPTASSHSTHTLPASLTSCSSPSWHLPTVGPMKPHSCGRAAADTRAEGQPKGSQACGSNGRMHRAQHTWPGGTCTTAERRADLSGLQNQYIQIKPYGPHLGDTGVHGVGPQHAVLGGRGGAVGVPAAQQRFGGAGEGR